MATSTFSATNQQFVQFEELVIATSSGGLIGHTLGSSSNFFTLGASAQSALAVGVIGQFVFRGNTAAVTGASYQVGWSAIGDPTNWPTPNSATAIATQSGVQFLHAANGAVTNIFGSDQFGVVLQTGGVTRVTYVGPPAVFQFDTIEYGRGCPFQDGAIQVGGLVYYASLSGFFVTDGIKITSISDAKCSKYFQSLISSSGTSLVFTGVDVPKNLIYWVIPTSGSSVLFIYNYKSNRWTYSNDVVGPFVKRVAGSLNLQNEVLRAFSQSASATRIGTFTGTPGTALMESGEVEPNTGGCALINGIKPMIVSSGAAPTIGVQVGSRDDQATTVSYASTTAPTSRTGFADFRSDARYHRARVYIAGNFDKALGLEIDATPTGAM